MSFDDNSSVVPLFIKKLKLLVDDEVMDEYIAWDSSGESFHIFDSNRLAKEVLPLYFKHNNISSFIRQLNMYGFRKLNRTDSGGVLRLESDEMEFYHAYFKRNRDDLLIRIQRKPKNFTSIYNGVNDLRTPRYNSNLQLDSADSEKSVSRAEFGQLVEMVKHIKNKQENSDQRIELLKLENEQLLRDLNDLRSKHENQANVVQTLFSFLTSYATDNRSYLAAKRKLALPNSTYDSNDKSNKSRAVVVLNNSPNKDANANVKPAATTRLILQSCNSNASSKKIARLTTGGAPSTSTQLNVKQPIGIPKSLNYKIPNSAADYQPASPDDDSNCGGHVTIEEVSGETIQQQSNNSMMPQHVSNDRVVIRVPSVNPNATNTTPHSLIVKQEPTLEHSLPKSITSSFTPYKKFILHSAIKKEFNESTLNSLRLNRNQLENFGYYFSQGESNETSKSFLNSALFNQIDKQQNDPNVITECVASSSSDTESLLTDVLSPSSDGQEVIPVSCVNRGLDLPIRSCVSPLNSTMQCSTLSDLEKLPSSEVVPVVDTIWHHPDIGLPSPTMEMNLFDSETESPVSNDEFIDSLLCSSDTNTVSNQPQFSSVEPQSPLALANNLSRLQKSSRSS